MSQIGNKRHAKPKKKSLELYIFKKGLNFQCFQLENEIFVFEQWVEILSWFNNSLFNLILFAPLHAKWMS